MKLKISSIQTCIRPTWTTITIHGCEGWGPFLGLAAVTVDVIHKLTGGASPPIPISTATNSTQHSLRLQDEA
jgi:hypothetical protein